MTTKKTSASTQDVKPAATGEPIPNAQTNDAQQQATTMPATATTEAAQLATPVVPPVESKANEEDEIEAIFVRAVPERRCRAGFCFDQQGHGIALSLLSEEQLAALEADPLLRVEHVTVPAQAPQE